MIDPTLVGQMNRLGVAERLELLGMLWDTLPHPQLPVSESEKRLLDARLADAESHPDNESPLDEVRKRLRARLP